MDYYFYNPLTDSSASSYFTKGSSAYISFSSNGMYSYATAAGNQAVSNHIILNQELPEDFELEFTYMGGDSYSVNVWVNGMIIQTSNRQHTRTWYMVGYDDITQVPPSVSDVADVVSVGDIFKFIKQNGQLKVYHNNNLMETYSPSSSVKMQMAILNCCGSSRNTRIKDLKIKQL